MTYCASVLRPLLPAALFCLVFLQGCFLNPGGEGAPSFREAVETVYAPCDADTLRLRAAEKNVQMVFEPCGSNNFLYYRWAPSGTVLYWQATRRGWVWKDTGENYPLRLGSPRSYPAWLSDTMLAYPSQDGSKIGVYNVDTHVLSLIPIDLAEPAQLTPGQGADEVLFLASDAPGGILNPFSLRVETGEIERTFFWLKGGMEDFSYRKELDIVCYREFAGKDVICARGEDGEELYRIKKRVRGALSIDGRYLVTEGPGTPVAAYQKTNAAMEEALDKGFIPKQIVPPSLWIYDTETGEEVQWTGVHGTHFQWYDVTPYFGSFLLWGLDSMESNRNVALADLRPYLRGQGWKPPLPGKVLSAEEVERIVGGRP